MSDVTRYAPRLRCPSCDGFVNLAAGVLDLDTGDRRVMCWACGAETRWTDDVLAVAPPGDLSLA